MHSESLSPPAIQPNLQDIATGKHEADRIRLAAAASTPAELLFFMANDHSAAVRAAIALNEATPAQADRCLTRDADERVRLVLARKLARIAPALSAQQQDRLARLAWDNLEVLAADSALKVRSLVAELVCDLPEAPRSLILSLAADPAFAVSDPVLRLSPVLTDEDLLGVLACNPSPHTAASIARRPNLGARVCDAISHNAGTQAVRELLANGSSCIREAALDALVARSADQIEWHDPLVRRPRLSDGQVLTLSGFVADHLIAVLAARPELDAALVADLHRRLTAHLPLGAPPADKEERAARRAGGIIPGPTPPQANTQRAHEPAIEEALSAAIRAGHQDKIIRLLAGQAGIAPQAVQHMARLRSAKAAVSVVWKAGLPMRLAVPIQSLLCNLGPGAIIRPGPDGAFPLSEEEMRWQLEFVSRSAV